MKKTSTHPMSRAYLMAVFLVLGACGGDQRLGRTDGGAGGSGGNGGGNGDLDSGTGGGGSGGRDAAMNPDNGCLENFNLEKGPPPDVVIVLDRSGSMTQVPKTGMGNLWEQTSRALKSAVMLTQADINFGIGFFPSDTNCVVDPVQVPVAAMNYPAVSTAIDGKKPNGNTPTTKAVEEGVKYLQTLTGPERKYLLLATDGAPNCAGICKCMAGWTPMGMNCCMYPAPGSSTCTNCTQDDADGAVAAVEAATMKGFHTFVVGLGTTPEFEMTLERMAVAGKEPNMAGTTSYFPVTDQTDLENAMKTIAARIVSCEFPLSKAPDKPDSTTVFMNGMMVPRDEMKMEGWDFGPGNMSIIFYGSWCDLVKTGSGKDVTAFFGCRTI